VEQTDGEGTTKIDLDATIKNLKNDLAELRKVGTRAPGCEHRNTQRLEQAQLWLPLIFLGGIF